MLTLNGLRIGMRAAGEAVDALADVDWLTERLETLPVEPGAGEPIATIREEQTASGVETVHIYGYDGRVRCRFWVAANGAAVQCQAVPDVSDRDIFSLFAEPVMRTILARRGLLSFHAAALAQNGRAILIMADKGAGKSTLSWTLQNQGWVLLSDDLARVDYISGHWSVYFGHRQTKLTPVTASALGLAVEAMPARYDDPGSPAYAALFDKRVIDASDAPADPLVAVPLSVQLFLTERCTSAATSHVERLTPPATAQQLLAHATPDPLGHRFSSPATQRAIGELTMQVPAFTLTLPDSFDRLADAAATLARFTLDREACV